MPTDFSFKNRLNYLKSKIENLSTGERSVVRNNLKNVIDTASSEAYTTMVNMTPQRPDEDDNIFQHRMTSWSGGVPDYVKVKSPNRSVRLYGSTLKDGWVMPKVDFIGSNLNTINISTTISNTAEHAKMVLTGNYKEKQWDIGLRDDKQALMWARNGGSEPYFVRRNSSNYPVRFRAGNEVSNKNIPQAGLNILNSYREKFMSVIKESIIEESRVTFR